MSPVVSSVNVMTAIEGRVVDPGDDSRGRLYSSEVPQRPRLLATVIDCQPTSTSINTSIDHGAPSSHQAGHGDLRAGRNGHQMPASTAGPAGVQLGSTATPANFDQLHTNPSNRLTSNDASSSRIASSSHLSDHRTSRPVRALSTVMADNVRSPCWCRRQWLRTPATQGTSAPELPSEVGGGMDQFEQFLGQIDKAWEVRAVIIGEFDFESADDDAWRRHFGLMAHGAGARRVLSVSLVNLRGPSGVSAEERDDGIHRRVGWVLGEGPAIVAVGAVQWAARGGVGSGERQRGVCQPGRHGQ